jgi:hypothetical protein
VTVFNKVHGCGQSGRLGKLPASLWKDSPWNSGLRQLKMYAVGRFAAVSSQGEKTRACARARPSSSLLQLYESADQPNHGGRRCSGRIGSASGYEVYGVQSSKCKRVCRGG